jgi:hypothetical protein
MSKKINYDYIKKYFNKFGYELLSNVYINSISKLKYKCPNGHINEMTYGNFYMEKRCPTCSRKEPLKYSYVKDYFEKFNYKLLSKEYKKSKEKLKFKCPNGHIHYISFDSFQRGSRCAYCVGKISKTYDQVKKYFEKNNYILLSKIYNHSEKKLKYMCNNGHINQMSFQNFKRGHRCPDCSRSIKKSRGEAKIEKFLKKNKIKFETQKSFNECKYKKRLRFDFYLINKNILIEYQGRQHYLNDDNNNFFFNEKELHNYKIRDNIKKKFCKKNNIKLIEIPYWDFDKIDKILNKVI